MRDPVSVCSGVTYDRSSIEAWFDRGNETCPATMQVLENFDLTPNHTLRRLIQEWCVANRSLGIERIPTPKSPADPLKVQRLMENISMGYSVSEALKELRSLATESVHNTVCIAENGAPVGLAAFLVRQYIGADSNKEKVTEICEEALHVLSSLPLNDQCREAVSRPEHLAVYVFLLNKGSLNARMNVAILLERLAIDNTEVGAEEGMIKGLVALLRENPSAKVEKQCMKALYALNLSRRNRAETVEAGAVKLIVESLPEAEKGVTEASLALLEVLCRCAEGRVATVEHAMGIAVVVKKLLRASEVATEHGLGVLWAVCRHCVEARREAAWVGGCAKLCLILQLDCTPTARRRAGKLLGLLHQPPLLHDCPCCLPTYLPFAQAQRP